MSFLTEQEIEKLKKNNPIKQFFRYVFLIIGIFMSIIGLILFLVNFDFGISISDFNISFIIDLLIIIFGIIIASRFFIIPYFLREDLFINEKLNDLEDSVDSFIKFYSFTFTKLILGLLLLSTGFISFLIFGSEIVNYEIKYANSLILRGNLFIYLTGLLAVLVGFNLLLDFVLNSFKGVFFQSKNFYFFYELRPFCPWLTRIPKQNVEVINYQNNHFSPKLKWVILLLPMIVLQLTIAVPSFKVEGTGSDYLLLWTFLIISILEIIVLIILVIFQEDYYKIVTNTHLYELWISPAKLKHQFELRSDLSNFFGCVFENNIKENPKTQIKFSELDNKHLKLFNLIFGLFLIISGILISRNILIFGPLFCWVALIYGFILLIKSISLDFSIGGRDIFYHDEENQIFKFKRKFSYKFQNITAYQVESVKIKKGFRKLDIFDLFGLGSMLIFIMIQQIDGWAITKIFTTINAYIINTLYVIIVILFIFFYICFPIDILEYKTPSVVNRIPITLKLDDKNIFQKCFFNIKNFPSEILKEEMLKSFLLRMFVILLLIIGSIAYSIYIIISSFN